MASRKNKAVSFNAADVANVAKGNPYIQRLVEDQDLRQNIQKAFGSGKSAYGRVAGNSPSARDLLADEDLQSDILTALEGIRDATLALTEAPKKGKGLRLGRKLLIVVLAAGLALAVSEQLRSKVLDALFGKEEQFEYTPPATPSSTPPTSPVSAA